MSLATRLPRQAQVQSQEESVQSLGRKTQYCLEATGARDSDAPKQ